MWTFQNFIRKFTMPTITSQGDLVRYVVKVTIFALVISLAADLTTATFPLPTAAGGLAFPVVFPVSFGASTTGGLAVVENIGTVETWPVATITGPVVSPAIELADTGDRVTVDVTLGADDVLALGRRAESLARLAATFSPT